MNLFENNWYVYFHRKPTDLKLFYIGIGMVKDYQKSSLPQRFYKYRKSSREFDT